MSAYQIDFSDPIRQSFTIPAGGLNGPGGSASNSTLRLYGRGALEWGEAVDEDLLRLSENFAAASPPSSANSGQIWVETKLYYHNSAAGNTGGWYRWNFTTSSWMLLNGTGSVGSVKPSVASIGQYWYGTDTFDGQTLTNVLWGYYSLGRYEPAKWLPRSFMEEATAPTDALIPEQVMRVRDGNLLTPGNTRGAWSVPNSTSVGEDPPKAPSPGMLWYQPSTGVLRVYSSDTTATGLLRWHDLIGPSLNGAATTIANGPISMKDQNTGTTYKITNVAAPTDLGDATNKKYVDDGLALKVAKAGDTMTGPLVVQALATLNSLVVNGTTKLTGLLTASAGALFGGILDMNFNRIINLGAPQADTDAANASYVQTTATTIANSVATTIVNNAVTNVVGNAPVINPSSTYKAGDMYVVGGKVYVAIGAGTGAPPGGNWRQIYPAVYS